MFLLRALAEEQPVYLLQQAAEAEGRQVMGCQFPQHHSGGGRKVPVKAAVTVLALAAAGGLARAVHPHLVVPWKLLAIAGTLAGCGLLALGGLAFSRWEQRREVTRLRAEQPVALRWRGGEPMREPNSQSKL